MLPFTPDQLAAFMAPEAIAQRKVAAEQNRLAMARDFKERNALTEGVLNPGYNPDRGNVRFNYTQYGSGANAIKYIDDARNVFKTYSELSPNQKGHENFRNYQGALVHNTGISDWTQATNRQLFEAIDDTFRGYQEDNQKENFKFGLVDAAKLAAAAAATFYTAGAAATAFGPSLGGTVAAGALGGAAGATTSGVLNNNLSLEGVATGALVGGAFGAGDYYFRPPVVNNPSALGGTTIDAFGNSVTVGGTRLHSIPQSLPGQDALFEGITATDVFGALPGGTGTGINSIPLSTRGIFAGQNINPKQFANVGGSSLGINPLPSATGPLVRAGGSAKDVFGALPATGDAVTQGIAARAAARNSEGFINPLPVGSRAYIGGNTAGLYPSGGGGILGGIGELASKVGDVASDVLSPRNLLVASAGDPPPELAESEQGGLLGGLGLSGLLGGVGSLASADRQPYVDPTPYLGRMALDPAFMNQFERAKLGMT